MSKTTIRRMRRLLMGLGAASAAFNEAAAVLGQHRPLPWQVTAGGLVLATLLRHVPAWFDETKAGGEASGEGAALGGS